MSMRVRRLGEICGWLTYAFERLRGQLCAAAAASYHKRSAYISVKSIKPAKNIYIYHSAPHQPVRQPCSRTFAHTLTHTCAAATRNSDVSRSSLHATVPWKCCHCPHTRVPRTNAHVRSTFVRLRRFPALTTWCCFFVCVRMCARRSHLTFSHSLNSQSLATNA